MDTDTTVALPAEGRPEKVWADNDLLWPGEVAELFRVDPKTVTRWTRAGRIPEVGDGRKSVIRTPGGHIRIRYKVVRMILTGEIELVWAPGEIEQTPIAR